MANKVIYQRTVTSITGDIVAGAAYTVTNEKTGLPLTIYSDREGLNVKNPPHVADSQGQILFYTDPGALFRIQATGGTGTADSRYNEALQLTESTTDTEPNRSVKVGDSAILLKDSIINVDSVADFYQFYGEEGQQTSLKGWHPDTTVGGGVFGWNPGRVRTDHTGGTVISPARQFTGDVAAYLAEVVDANLGCWERLDVSCATPWMFGAKGDGSNEIASLQALFYSEYRDRIGGKGAFKIESTLFLRTGTKVVGAGYRELRIYTDADRNINLLRTERFTNNAGDISKEIHIENIELDHNRITDFTSETLMTILIVGGRDIRIKGVTIRNPNTDGIYISDTYGGVGNVLNLPQNIIIEDLECIGDFHNRNGISVIAGKNIRMRNHKYVNMSRSDMPGAIDLEPNDTTQFISDVIIENIEFVNCKQGMVSDFVADKTNTDQIKDITVRNIYVLGTPVQDGSYSEFTDTSSTQGITINRASNVTVDNCTVISANSNSMAFDNINGLKITNATIRDARTHGIVIRDCTKVDIDGYDIDCVNGVFNSIKTKGVLLTYRQTGLDHLGVRLINIGSGTINQQTSSADTFALCGIGNIKDLSVTGMIVSGDWSEAILQSNGSSGWPDNWEVSYNLTDDFSGVAAKFSITAGQTVNGKWICPGFTSGVASIVANTDKLVSTPFRVNSESVFSCSLLTPNAEPCSVNTSTAGNIQLVFPSSTTANVFWQLERP